MGIVRRDPQRMELANVRRGEMAEHARPRLFRRNVIGEGVARANRGGFRRGLKESIVVGQTR
jgi:hypothetical protein